MSLINDLLLQLTLMAIAIFTYHTFFIERSNKNSIFQSVLWMLSIILCMSFSVSIGPTYRFDLRLVPLILGTLYCGRKTGMFLSFFIIIYRLYFGVGIGVYHTILALISTIPVVFFFQESFEMASKEKRIRISVLLSCYYSLVVIAWFYILKIDSFEYLTNLLIFLAVSVFSTLLIITLNENLIELHRLRLEIQYTEKLKVLSDLTSSFAHEIRNPMQVNRGFLQLMEKESVPEHVKGYIDLCIKEMDRANEIISDYLSFAKPQIENLTPIDVSNHLNQVENIISPYAWSNGVEIKINTENNIFVMADPQKLKQCLINLIKNGIEAMPNGGVINISCYSQDSDRLLIEIIDHGIGMTKEQMTRLGTPFYSLKEKGTGLGLMVTFRLIHSLDGTITVNSELGKGSVFSVNLPKFTE